MDKAKLKKILMYAGIAIGILIVIVVVSMLTSSSDTPTPTSGGLVSSNQTVPTVPAAASSNPASTSNSVQMVALLKNLSGIRLNDSVFSYPAFKSLQDISIVLPTPTSEGRQNPFAPIGSASLQSAPVEVDTALLDTP